MNYQNEKLVHIGTAIFRNQINQNQWKKLISQDTLEILNNEKEWWICHHLYQYNNWKTIFQYMKSTNALKIQLGRNGHEDILKQIVSVSFINLRHICFGKNNIGNIEAIQYLKAPLVKKISFQQNHITNLKPLRKAHLPNLRILNLSANKLKQLDLSQLNCFKLSKIIIQPHRDNIMQGEDINWIFKLQSKNVQILRFRSGMRIHRDPLFQIQFKKRYKNIILKHPNDSNQDSSSDSYEEECD